MTSERDEQTMRYKRRLKSGKRKRKPKQRLRIEMRYVEIDMKNERRETNKIANGPVLLRRSRVMGRRRVRDVRKTIGAWTDVEDKPRLLIFSVVMYNCIIVVEIPAIVIDQWLFGEWTWLVRMSASDKEA